LDNEIDQPKDKFKIDVKNMINKTNKKGFFCASDTVFFNKWTKIFIMSVRQHAPWANVRVHIYDGVDRDVEWCQKKGVECSTEPTPLEYTKDLDSKKGFWVCDRFRQVVNLFEDQVPVWCVDSDSVLHKDLSEDDYEKITSQSWVNVWGEPNTRDYKTIGYSVVFSSNDRARHEIVVRLSNQKKFAWYLDQDVMDSMLIDNYFAPVERTYSNHVYNKDAYIWSGKGKRKEMSSSNLQSFPGLASYYKKILDNETT
jgi:hypothetical protein